MTTLDDVGGVLGRPFGLSQFHGHSSWLVCEVALIVPWGFSGGGTQ
jgi:hypothetical protein